MKHEWKKQEKHLYLPGQRPVLVTVPAQKFLMLRGRATQTAKRLPRKSAFSIPFPTPSK